MAQLNSTVTNGQVAGFTQTPDNLQLAMAPNYLQVVPAALLVFDVSITLDKEIRLVWHGRWGIPSCLYILNRYGTLIRSFPAVALVFATGLDASTCLSWVLFEQWTIPIALLLAEATLTIRVLVLYKNNSVFSMCLWIWYLITAAASLSILGLTLQGTYEIPSVTLPVFRCGISSSMSFMYQLWIPGLVFEITLVSLTAWKAVQHRRLLSPASLIHVLIRDGFFYFFIVFANLIVALVTSRLYDDWVPGPCVSLASTLASRLFLNLREVAYIEPEAAFNSSGPLEMTPVPRRDTEDSQGGSSYVGTGFTAQLEE